MAEKTKVLSEKEIMLRATSIKLGTDPREDPIAERNAKPKPWGKCAFQKVVHDINPEEDAKLQKPLVGDRTLGEVRVGPRHEPGGGRQTAEAVGRRSCQNPGGSARSSRWSTTSTRRRTV